MSRFEINLEELAAIVAGSIIINPEVSQDCCYTDVESLERATRSDVSFLGNLKYKSDFQSSKAGVILVPKEVSEHPDPEVALIAVENPSSALAALTEYIQELTAVPSPSGIRNQADVDPSVVFGENVSIDSGARIMAGVVIGSGTRIDAGVVVYPNAKIGDDCHLQANVVVREGCVLGDRCIIQSNTVIGSDGYGYEFVDGRHQKVPQIGIVVIGDDVEIGSNSSIDRARFGRTTIGKGTKIDNLVQVAHNVDIGEHCLLVAQSGIAGSSSLGNYTTIAAQAGVVGHIKIADKVTALARATITKSITKSGFYSGFPARKHREDQRTQVYIRQLDKLISRVSELEKKLEEKMES